MEGQPIACGARLGHLLSLIRATSLLKFHRPAYIAYSGFIQLHALRLEVANAVYTA